MRTTIWLSREGVSGLEGVGSFGVSTGGNEVCLPIRIGQLRELYRLLAGGSMNKAAIAYIETDMRCPFFSLAEKQQIARGEFGKGDAAGIAQLFAGGAGDRDAVALIGVVDQAAAVETLGCVAPISIGFAQLRQGGLYRGVVLGWFGVG